MADRGYKILRVNDDASVTVMLDIDGRELQEDVAAEGFEDNVRVRLDKFEEDLKAAAEREALCEKVVQSLPAKVGDRIAVK